MLLVVVRPAVIEPLQQISSVGEEGHAFAWRRGLSARYFGLTWRLPRSLVLVALLVVGGVGVACASSRSDAVGRSCGRRHDVDTSLAEGAAIIPVVPGMLGLWCYRDGCF